MDNTREAILHTTLQLFADKGFAAVSVSMIAGSLGLTKGALYGGSSVYPLLGMIALIISSL